MKTIFIIVFSFSMLPLTIGAVTRVTVEGVIVAYDKETVTLSQKSGKKIKVPRKSIPHYFKIQGGNKVYVEYDPKAVLKELRKNIQKKKRKNKKN